MIQEPILVTGATGFTGSHLCRRLIEEGYQVRALVRDLQKAKGLVDLGVELTLGDIRDPESIKQATEGINSVFHIAAIFRSESVPKQEMWETNATGTRNMLEASISSGVKRFIHCSTVGVLGDILDPPGTELTPYNPGDHYQESKLEGEKIAIEYIRANRLPIVIFRPGGIYGPGDLRFLKLFKYINQHLFIMFGTGEVDYQLIYIDDLIDGILLCATKEEAMGQVYILTGDAPVTLNQLCREIAFVLDVPPPRLHIPVTPVYLASYLVESFCKPFGIEPPIYRRRVDFFRKNRSFSIIKAREELGFCPKVDLRTGLQNTANWYKDRGFL